MHHISTLFFNLSSAIQYFCMRLWFAFFFFFPHQCFVRSIRAKIFLGYIFLLDIIKTSLPVFLQNKESLIHSFSILLISLMSDSLPSKLMHFPWVTGIEEFLILFSNTKSVESRRRREKFVWERAVKEVINQERVVTRTGCNLSKHFRRVLRAHFLTIISFLVPIQLLLSKLLIAADYSSSLFTKIIKSRREEIPENYSFCNRVTDSDEWVSDFTRREGYETFVHTRQTKMFIKDAGICKINISFHSNSFFLPLLRVMISLQSFPCHFQP